MSDIKAKLIALVDNYTDPLSVKDIHKADFAEKFADHLLASGFIEELQNETYDLGVDSALHNHFGLSWEDAAGLRKEITRLQEATKWIPVTERLPEKGVRVLVMLGENARSYTMMDTDQVRTNTWVRWGKAVTHWMPLPQPPKEGA